MLRKLEELDRLDLLNPDPEQVLWPGGRSSRHDPRAWEPRRHRPTANEPWWQRHRTAAFILSAGVLAAGWFGAPHLGEWTSRLTEARPAAGQPHPPASGSKTRVLPPVTMTDVPSASRLAFLATQDDGSGPVTFDPCRPTHYVVRDRPEAGSRGAAVIAAAVAEVSNATGLEFVDDGATEEAPSSDRALCQPDRYGEQWAPILIAWSDAAEQPELGGRTAGLGGGLPLRDTHDHLTYLSGTVWLDTPDLAPDLATPAGSAGVQAVIMHELGHVLGAAHVSDSRELMNGENSGLNAFGVGDRYGLSVLGNGQCVPGI
jgi:hypothetical protein